MNTRFAILAAALGATLSATPTLAETQSVGVGYADLDLTTPAGQAELDHRIRVVAEKICGIGEIRTATRLPSSTARECLRDTVASTKEQVAARISRETLKRG